MSRRLLLSTLLLQTLLPATSLLLAQETPSRPTSPQTAPSQTAPSQTASGQTTSSASSNDQNIELMRQNVRDQKKQLIAANLPLTPEEAEKFWPVYDQYTADAAKIGDQRVALMKQYASAYPNLSDSVASDLVKKSLASDQEMAQLRIKYVPIFEKVISPKKTAMFFQIDRRLASLIDLQLASEVPLVPAK